MSKHDLPANSMESPCQYIRFATTLVEICANFNRSPMMICKRPLATLWQGFTVDLMCFVPVTLFLGNANCSGVLIGQKRCVTFVPTTISPVLYLWWRHQMETISALLAICAGNSPVTGEFPAQRPVTRSFDVFFDLRLTKWLSKQW